MNRRLFLALAASGASIGVAASAQSSGPNPADLLGASGEAYFTNWLNDFYRRSVAAGWARPVLDRALAGLIADRDITGGGVEVPFFGVPAPIPAGPGLLAVQSHVPAFVAGAWRTTPGHYRGRLERIDPGAVGTRREQVTAFLTAEVAAFERLIARAPDQWWAVFFPIWPDEARV